MATQHAAYQSRHRNTAFRSYKFAINLHWNPPPHPPPSPPFANHSITRQRKSPSIDTPSAGRLGHLLCISAAALLSCQPGLKAALGKNNMKFCIILWHKHLHRLQVLQVHQFHIKCPCKFRKCDFFDISFLLHFEYLFLRVLKIISSAPSWLAGCLVFLARRVVINEVNQQFWQKFIYKRRHSARQHVARSLLTHSANFVRHSNMSAATANCSLLILFI